MESDGAFWDPTAEKGDLKNPWRRRQDGCNRLPLLSFHAAATFAGAASLQGTLLRRAGLPVFLAAGFVLPARDQEGKPYWSDTLFAAVPGPIIGVTLEILQREAFFHTASARR